MLGRILAGGLGFALAFVLLLLGVRDRMGQECQATHGVIETDRMAAVFPIPPGWGEIEREEDASAARTVYVGKTEDGRLEVSVFEENGWDQMVRSVPCAADHPDLLVYWRDATTPVASCVTRSEQAVTKTWFVWSEETQQAILVHCTIQNRFAYMCGYINASIVFWIKQPQQN